MIVTKFKTVISTNVFLSIRRFYAQPVMWIKALELVVDRLVVQEGDLSSVMTASGSAEQHRSLYWSRSGVHLTKSRR